LCLALREWIQKCQDQLKIARAEQQAAILHLGGKDPILRAYAIASAKQFLESTDRELHAAKGDLRRAKSGLETLTTKPGPLKVPDAEITAEINKNPEIVDLHKRTKDLKTQEDMIRARAPLSGSRWR